MIHLSDKLSPLPILFTPHQQRGSAKQTPENDPLHSLRITSKEISAYDPPLISKVCTGYFAPSVIADGSTIIKTTIPSSFTSLYDSHPSQIVFTRRCKR